MQYSDLLPLLAALPSAISAPMQPDFSNTTTLPVHFGLMVFDHFQALDVFGPMDVLNSLFMLYSNNTTPHFSVLSKNMSSVPTSMMRGGFGQEIVPTTTFKEYLAEHKNAKAKRRGDGNDHGSPFLAAKPDIDVLIVPGGGGTRRNMTEEINFVKTLYPNLKYILSICTGATILSRSGILNGRKATTNKRSWKWAVFTSPNVTWVPTARWVEDGNVITSSGISAGIDATYAFVSKVYGEDVAEYMSKSLEYHRETDPHNDPYGLIWDVPGAT